MGSALRAPQTTWLVLNGSPETGYPATQSEDPGTGGRTPLVTAPTLVAVLLTMIGDPGSRYLAFAIDATGRCSVQDRAGCVTVLVPTDDGHYDLGELHLDWTFRDGIDRFASDISRGEHAAQPE